MGQAYLTTRKGSQSHHFDRPLVGRNDTTMKFVNLTTHTINFNDLGVRRESFQPSGIVATIQTERSRLVGDEGGVWIKAPSMGVVVGLPEPQEGVGFVVSRMVAEALRSSGRKDIYCPGTNPEDVIRNKEGQIEAVKCFYQLS